jgi:FtsZ-interacting cell division protein ZipA
MGRTGGFSMKFHCHAIIIGLFSILALLLLDIYFNRKSYRREFHRRKFHRRKRYENIYT